jgi:Fibronectin type III domain.
VVFTSSVPADPRVGDTYEPSAEATGGLPVSFSITGGDGVVCELDGDEVTFLSAPDDESPCVVTASSDGVDTNYEAASDVTQVIVVGEANQTITFPAVSDKGFDDVPFQLSATSSRGLDVTYATSSDACSVTTGGVVSIDAVGPCVVTASQAGITDQVAAASDVSRSFRIQAVVPGAPRLTSVGFGDEELTVGFIAPEYDGGADIDSYRAVATDGDDNQLVNNDCAKSSPCTITGLTNGTEYTVTIAAINDAGVGPVSNTSPSIAPAGRANAVTALSTVPGDGVLDVSWTSPALADIGGGDVQSV